MYWEDQYGSPPYGHAEESSLQSFTRHIGVNTEKAIALLKENNITVQNSSQKLREIAEQNHISSKVIYETIKSKSDTGVKKLSTNSGVSSLGRRTLKELADMNKIDLEKSLVFLKNKGFDATPQSKMRESADALGVTPYALYEQLKMK